MKKNISILVCFVLVLFVMGSCAVSNTIATDVSQNAKNQAPPPGKSLVYVYRVSAFGFLVGLDVSLNNKMLGSFFPKKFYLCTLDPGKYVFTGHGENENDLILTTEPDKKYYIEVKPRMGFATAGIALEQQDLVTGNEGVQKCKMIGSNSDIAPISGQNVKPDQGQQTIGQVQQPTAQVQSEEMGQSSSRFNATQQGNYILSGSSNLGFGSTKVENSYKSTSFSFNPSFGYFVIDNLAIGLDFGTSFGNSTWDDGYKSSNTYYSVMPTVIYYFPMEGKIRPMAQVGYGLFSGDTKTTTSSGTTSSSKNNGSKLKAAGGFAYFVRDNISFDFGLSYNITKYKDSPSKTNRLGSNVGISVYF